MPTTMNRREFLRFSAMSAIGAGLFTVGLAPSALASPAAKEGLLYLSASEQIAYFKAGSLSPVDVLKAQIDQIKKHNGPLNTSGKAPKDYMGFNGKVNAITYEHFREALKAAKESEKRYKNGTPRALEGVSVAVKDENDVKGWRVTMGSVVLQDAPPCEENAAIIDMLLAEGAILHIQTTVPELYLHIQTWSYLWGVTRNPWNLHYAVGGSSGGSGAALAAGFASLATGSDMGGSIRIPASLCGLYGFKAPFGRVPTSEISYETLGPMARTFDDLVLMQNVISGPHPKSHASLRPKLEYPQTYDSLKGVKIALDYFDSWPAGGIDKAVRQSLTDAANVLRAQGAIVEEVKLGWTSAQMFHVYVQGLLATSMGAMVIEAAPYKDQLTSYARQFLETASSGGPTEQAIAEELIAELHLQLQDAVFSKGYRALIMPTLSTPYIPADYDPTVKSVQADGKPLPGLDCALTFVWNLLSRYPVVDVPVGIADNNIPMGMQVVGNTYDDLAAFQVAHGYSKGGLRLYQGGLLPDYRNKA